MPPQPVSTLVEVPELKVACNSIVSSSPVWIEHTFNNYYRLLKVTAWCRQFVSNIKASLNNQPKLQSPYLATSEMQSTEQQLFHLTQQQSFSAELIRLNQQQFVGSSSPIKALSPFVDEHGIIRVAGRLVNALSSSQIHPVILSNRSRVAQGYFVINIFLWAIAVPLSQIIGPSAVSSKLIQAMMDWFVQHSSRLQHPL